MGLYFLGYLSLVLGLVNILLYLSRPQTEQCVVFYALPELSPGVCLFCTCVLLVCSLLCIVTSGYGNLLFETSNFVNGSSVAKDFFGLKILKENKKKQFARI